MTYVINLCIFNRFVLITIFDICRKQEIQVFIVVDIISHDLKTSLFNNKSPGKTDSFQESYRYNKRHIFTLKVCLHAVVIFFQSCRCIESVTRTEG